MSGGHGIGGLFGFHFVGGEKAIAQMEKQFHHWEASMYTAMTRCCLLVEGEAKKLIASGYYKPAIDTGTMRNSIHHEVVFQPSENSYFGLVGTTVHYAIYVHEGVANHKVNAANAATKGGWKMKPRPFLYDALNAKKEEIKNTIVAAFKGGVLPGDSGGGHH